MKSLNGLIAVVLLTVAMVFVSCKGSGGTYGPTAEIKFTEDSTKVGGSVSAGEIRVRIPKGWMSIDSVMLATLRNVSGQDSGKFAATPVAVFQDPGNGAFLKIMTMARPITSGDNFMGWGRSFIESARSSVKANDLSADFIALGGLPAVQVYYGDSKNIQLRYLVEAHPIVELDFTVPRDSWKFAKPFVQACLGSVRKS